MDTLKLNKIETERLFLRELTPDVYNQVFCSYSDADIKDFFGIQSDEALFKEKEKFKKGLTTFNKSFCNFQIIIKNNNIIIGMCGFHTWAIEHYRAELGYAIHLEAEKRKGYMKEALKPIIKYGFDKMNLHRIEALIGPNNITSIALVKGLGFIQEGHLREHYLKDGAFEDSLVFSLLQKEFEDL